MRNLNYLNCYRDDLFMGYKGNEKNGFFRLPHPKGFGFYLVLASDGWGWDHVSISLIDNLGRSIDRTLNWEEMEEIKKIFFKDDEDVVEFHPREEDYINEHPYVLHLWRPNLVLMPTPNEKEYDPDIETRKICLQKKDEKGYYLVKFSQTQDFQRVNVSLLDNDKKMIYRFPTWDEMCEVKETYFDPNWAAIEVHNYKTEMNMKKKEDYSIDIWMPFTKELPLPPTFLVGTKKKVLKR